MKKTKQPELIILGAGLSGLSAGYHSKGKPVIYERAKAIGGTCSSVGSNGFKFDQGIHVLHTKNSYVLNLLQNVLNNDFKIQDRSAWIYSYNRLTKYPFQINTYGLPIGVVLECLLEFIKLKNGKPAKKIKNYQDWIYSRFGKGFAENFYIPYSEKFWRFPTKDMTTDWLDVRVPVPEVKDVIRGAIALQNKEFGPNAMFRYPLANTISQLPRSFLTKKLNIFLEKEAVKIEPKFKKIHFSDGEIVKYDSLISTIPLPDLISLIVDVPSKVKKAGMGLKYNSIFCVNLGVNRKNINGTHWIYFPEEKFSFFRISFMKNFSPYLAPKNKSSICAEISYLPKDPIDKGKIVDTVINDLIKAKILNNKDRIEFDSVNDIKYGYCIYDKVRKTNLKIIEKFLKTKNIFTAGRYGRWEYQWMDDAILDGKRAAQDINNKDFKTKADN